MSAIRNIVADSADLTEVPMVIPEWGDVKVLLISPTVKERNEMIDAYTEWTEDVDGKRVPQVDTNAMSVALLISCVHDPETRERAFEAADEGMLKTKNGAVVERVGRACLPLVGFAPEGATEAGKGDSSTTPSADTESASPVASADL